MTVLVVVALLAAAVALGFPPQARLPPGLGRPRRTGAPGPRTVGLLGAGAAAVVVLGFPAHGPLLGMVLGASAADLVRRAAARRGRAAASARTAAVLAACDAVAADLRAGVPPVPALESAAAAWAEL
ncbi:hypothetical protein AB4Y76_19965, partial [Marmoricola sp. RAF53]